MNLYPVLVLVGVVTLIVTFALFARVRGQQAAREIDGAMEVLRSLRWKEFAQYVTTSFTQRGFKMAPSQRAPGEGGIDFVLERAGMKHLLQIKHGGAYSVGPQAVRSLLGMLDSREAKGGLLVTSGKFDTGAQEAARGQPVTLIDGAALWKELRPLVPGAMREEAVRRGVDKGREARQRALMIGLVGLLLAIGGGAGLAWEYYSTGGLGPRIAVPMPPAPTPATPAATSRPSPNPNVPRDVTPNNPPATAATAPATTPTPAEPAASTPPPPAPAASVTPEPAATSAPTSAPLPARELTDSEIATQRELAAAEVLLVNGVASATWPTRSTMLVVLREKDPPNRSEILQGVCQRVTARESLRFTRLQVTTFGTDPSTPGATRWFQCR